MNTQAIEITNFSSSDSYQLISNEHLRMIVVSAQVLTCSRIQGSSYKNVVFSECTFYGCDFNGIAFDNCIFENCIFEFSHLRKCDFKNCNFQNCSWKGSSSLGSVYEACDLGQELSDLCHNGKNTLTPGKGDYSTDIYIQLALAS